MPNYLSGRGKFKDHLVEKLIELNESFNKNSLKLFNNRLTCTSKKITIAGAAFHKKKYI